MGQGACTSTVCWRASDTTLRLYRTNAAVDTARKSVRTGDRKNYDEIPENATHGQVSPRIFSITVKRDCPVRSMQVPRHTFPAETGNTNSTRDLDRRGT
jgi:hypothetical protein